MKIELLVQEGERVVFEEKKELKQQAANTETRRVAIQSDARWAPRVIQPIHIILQQVKPSDYLVDSLSVVRKQFTEAFAANRHS